MIRRSTPPPPPVSIYTLAPPTPPWKPCVLLGLHLIRCCYAPNEELNCGADILPLDPILLLILILWKLGGGTWGGGDLCYYPMCCTIQSITPLSAFPWFDLRPLRKSSHHCNDPPWPDTALFWIYDTPLITWPKVTILFYLQPNPPSSLSISLNPIN